MRKYDQISGARASRGYLQKISETAAWLEGGNGICFESHLLPFGIEGECQHWFL